MRLTVILLLLLLLLLIIIITAIIIIINSELPYRRPFALVFTFSDERLPYVTWGYVDKVVSTFCL